MTSRDAFYFYIEHDTHSLLQDKINFKVYRMYPVHHCPSNLKNTCSPSVIKKFSGFHQSILTINDNMKLVDIHDYVVSTIPVSTHNDMDYIEFDLLSIWDLKVSPLVNTAQVLRHLPCFLQQIIPTSKQ
jgi:hypothetical protein